MSQDNACATSGITGVPSGFTDLDKETAGFQRSDLIVLAARPGMGKTAFALNVAQNAASKANAKVVVFSLEMSKEQLRQRLDRQQWFDIERTMNVNRHPNMWYALGRWLLYYEQMQKDENNNDFEHIAEAKHGDLIKAIGGCAITNINKVYGKESSGKEFRGLAKKIFIQNVLLQEIEIIKPKTIFMCGVTLPKGFQPNTNQTIIKLEHAGSRKSTNTLLSMLKDTLS